MIAPRVRAPRGFRFEIGEAINHYSCNCSACQEVAANNIIVKLMDGNRKAGYITLVPHDKSHKSYETHSWLDGRYRNKKFGALLYARAIQWCLDHNKKARSSGASSEMAQRVWRGKTIRKYFSIRKVVKKIYKTNPYCRTCLDDYATWFAYNKRR